MSFSSFAEKRKEMARGSLTLVDTSGLVVSNGLHTIQCMKTEKKSGVALLKKEKDEKFGVIKLTSALASNQIAQNGVFICIMHDLF